MWKGLLAAAVVVSSFVSIPSPILAESRRECPDQAATLLAKVEPLISEFREERRTATETPRMSLAAQIAKLKTIRRKTRELDEWPESSCNFRLRDRLDSAEDWDIERLERFLAGGNDPGTAKARELWGDVDRQLRDLRDLVAATRR